MRTVSEYYSPKQETDNKFDRILNQLDRDREQRAIKWQQQHQENKDILARLDRDRDEQAIKWQKNNQQWQEQNQQNKEILEEIKKLYKKHDSTMGALGSRWGLYSEASFRNGLKGILEDSFGMYIFNRKVEFYQKHHQRMVNRKLVISPMIDQNALKVAEKLAIEVFSYADDVTDL